MNVLASDTVMILFSGLCLLALGIVCTLLWVQTKLKNLQTFLYTVRDPNGIESLDTVTIGGIEQCLHIRGRNKDSPILLFLHGGPGFPNIGWFDAIQRPWEDYFTVVQWDQRQQGKSYYPMKAIGKTMNNQQMIADTEEVIAYLRTRFKQDKIFLMGKSYGSYLGMHMVSRHPEWLHAYIGDGQIISAVGYIESEYNHLLKHARSVNNPELIAKLEAIHPRIDPDNPWGSFVAHEGFIWRELNKIGKGMTPRFSTIEQYATMAPLNRWTSPLLTWTDHFNRKFGDKDALSFPEYQFTGEFMGIDINMELGTDFDVPIFLMTGAHDWHVPRDYQTQWFDSLSAPYKEQIIYENSTHVPYLEEPGKYTMVLISKVLPLCQKEQ